LPILRHLVKVGEIEKKSNIMLWRPTNAIGALLGNGSNGNNDRDKDRGKDRDKTHRDRPDKPTRRRSKPNNTHRTRKGKGRRKTNRRDSKGERGIRKAGRVVAATSTLSAIGGSSVGSSIGGRITSTFM
jgi:hypothetical protein